MALDARIRSSIYNKLLDLLGDEDANALMSEFPAVEADELVTKQFLRAEMAEGRAELQAGFAGLRAEFQSEMHSMGAEMAERFHQQTLWLGGGLAGATALVLAAIPVLS